MKKKEKRMNDIMDLIREQPSISVKALAQVSVSQIFYEKTAVI